MSYDGILQHPNKTKKLKRDMVDGISSSKKPTTDVIKTSHAFVEVTASKSFEQASSVEYIIPDLQRSRACYHTTTLLEQAVG